MSDHWITLIPALPNYVPPTEVQQKALAYFRDVAPQHNEITAKTTDKISLIDCGANFNRILCPSCGSEIGIAWWATRMDEEYAEGFPLKPYLLPCCPMEKNLNELNYDWPQGFSRFRIEARNPNLADLPQETMHQFEEILGCKLRMILRHL